jgi:hypothetical protein
MHILEFPIQNPFRKRRVRLILSTPSDRGHGEYLAPGPIRKIDMELGAALQSLCVAFHVRRIRACIYPPAVAQQR